MNSNVSIIKCGNYNPSEVEAAVRKAIDLIGGVSQYIKPGSKVLVKPNMLMAKEPEYGIDTHPEVVRAVIKILKDINCVIIVGDGPSVWGNEIQNVAEVYRRTGIAAVCSEEKVKLVEFDKRRMRRDFPLATIIDECDYLVNLPKFKTHEFTLLSGAIKNLFGLVSGTFKMELHKKYFNVEDFSRILVDIYEEVKPGLTVIDGIMAMEGDGPATSGKLRDLGLILAGSDCVALDSIMAKIMGIEPFDVLTTKEAAGRNLGEARLERIKISGEDLKALKLRPFILPKTSTVKKKMRAPVLKLLKGLIRYYPVSIRRKCTKCSACIKICPNKCISMGNEGIFFDYKKCIACFCCQEACPAAAIAVKKSLLAKMIGL